MLVYQPIVWSLELWVKGIIGERALHGVVGEIKRFKEK